MGDHQFRVSPTRTREAHLGSVKSGGAGRFGACLRLAAFRGSDGRPPAQLQNHASVPTSFSSCMQQGEQEENLLESPVADWRFCVSPQDRCAEDCVSAEAPTGGVMPAPKRSPPALASKPAFPPARLLHAGGMDESVISDVKPIRLETAWAVAF